MFRMPFETLLIAGCFVYALSAPSALAFLVHPFASRMTSSLPHQSLKATRSAKDSLFDLLDQVPRDNLTSQRLTAGILRTVRLMEKECPTPDDKVLQALAGKCIFFYML